ncbi:hypothetical protein SAMN04487765_1836 [Tenacibaculum sp. MAR_2010_89]|uniref:hypothetical protein n=1 Tax=Tenacibaculum sp. MAR_2010_89 TaxID=1250198 RepID=UPI0008997B71|nr:hypothetical protein [Tenacibaculum sp. MAR_2010_89]SEE23066.1 hypothetical protein SAMN04487765_1836 [Tenacibaculum sp. MAR_2010_89]
MAYTYKSNTTESISLEEFIDTLNRTISSGDEDSLLACVDPLFKISNNANFFTEYLNKQLASDLSDFQNANVYSEQSYMIYECKDFYIRVTYWPVLSNNNNVRDSQNELFSYDFAHDHNFPLLTAGYKGGGYITKLWEYDYEKVIGYANEKVDIRFLEEVTLAPGRALYYRPSKDIHSQFAPLKEDSLAINIIMKSNKYSDCKQYEFDMNKKVIKNVMHGSSSARFGLLELTNLVYNSTTIDLLHKLSKTHELPQVREESLKALYNIEKTNEVWKIGLQDIDKSVQLYSELRIENNT